MRILAIVTGILALIAILATSTISQIQAQMQMQQPMIKLLDNHWDPPKTKDGLKQKCIQQAQISNVDPYQYCTYMAGICNQYDLSLNVMLRVWFM